MADSDPFELELELREFVERLSASGRDTASSGADLFHDQFFSLDPNAATLVTREQLRSALPARAAMFTSIGARGTCLRDLAAHRIDEQHVLVQTTWDVLFAEPSTEPLVLSSSYLLRRAGADWSVLAYINHQDIGALVSKRRASA